MFGGAGIAGFYALGALIATAILALATAVAAWLAALIVTTAFETGSPVPIFTMKPVMEARSCGLVCC